MRTHTSLIDEGFVQTDPSTNQWVKRIDINCYEVFERGRVIYIDLRFWKMAEIEAAASAYYEGGLMGLHEEAEDQAEANWLVAEILAESYTI